MRKLLALVSLTAALCAALALCVVPATGSPAHGRQTVGRIVHPVHRDGTPVAGYTVHKQQIPDFHCNEGASPVAVDDNIRMCGPSATYTVACWKSARHTVLCLRNPRKKVLVRIRYVGKFRHARALDKPSPQALALFNGVYCTILIGGAFPAVKGHPKWRADYSCLNGSYVYGRGRDGIDRSAEPWRVHLVHFHKNGGQTIRTRQVRLAYYAGTAN
jgi:hypothetical protein